MSIQVEAFIFFSIETIQLRRWDTRIIFRTKYNVILLLFLAKNELAMLKLHRVSINILLII